MVVCVGFVTGAGLGVGPRVLSPNSAARSSSRDGVAGVEINSFVTPLSSTLNASGMSSLSSFVSSSGLSERSTWMVLVRTTPPPSLPAYWTARGLREARMLTAGVGKSAARQLMTQGQKDRWRT